MHGCDPGLGVRQRPANDVRRPDKRTWRRRGRRRVVHRDQHDCRRADVAGQIARDLAGNVGTSPVVLVTVNNAAPPPPPPPPPGPLVRTPDVVGRPLADAQSRIAAVGLTSTFTSANDPKVKAGEIISQSPARDTLVPSGSNVALVVSLGP